MLATSTHGTRGRNREPRASVRTIGVAITATRWTRSATSSASSSTAMSRLPSAADVTRSGLSRIRSMSWSKSPPTASSSLRSRSGSGSERRVASVPSRGSGSFVAIAQAAAPLRPAIR